jgi:hypothetical protein
VLALIIKINDFPVAVKKERSKRRFAILRWLGIEGRVTFEEVAHQRS